MNEQEFQLKYNEYKCLFEKYLDSAFIIMDCPQKKVFESMKYSLEAGGKRIRPVFALAFGDLFEVSLTEVLPFAAAIEMIHTYSLIHDDLPAMDNDDLRRGKPTNHIVYGEAIAILAGDALLNRAFENMLAVSLGYNGDKLKNAVAAMNAVAVASGCMGMIGGQVVDMEAENREITADELKYMHLNKTGALLRASCIVPALLSGRDNTVDDINLFSEYIGLLFQIKDDILDVESSEEVLGKPVGSDKEQGKSTFVSIYGIEKCRRSLEEYMNKAMEIIDKFDSYNTDFIKSLMEYLYKRNN